MITVNIRYKGEGDNALKFAEEMTESGVAERIRQEQGNLRYEYFISMEDPSVVLLTDSWADLKALDEHHGSDMMETIAKLRDKYDLHMEVERFTSEEGSSGDERFIRK